MLRTICLSLALSVSPALAANDIPTFPRVDQATCDRLLNAIAELSKYINIMGTEGCGRAHSTRCLSAFAFLHTERERLAVLYRSLGCHLYYQF